MKRWLSIALAFGLLIPVASAGPPQPSQEQVAAGYYQATTPTYASGLRVPMNFDQHGNLLVNLQSPVDGSGNLKVNIASPVLSFDGSGNLKVNVSAGGGAGGTSSNFGGAFPGTGTAAGFKNAGGNMDFALVDGSNNLNVNCVVGCAGGTFNNNADGVATSATNGQSAAWLYGFNGTTWDRLRIDASKNLNVNIAANSFGTLTVGGTVAATQSGTWSVRAQDGAGTALTSTGGALDVNLKTSSITLGVSGTVTANQGGAPWSVSGSGNFSVTQSTSPWVDSVTTWGGGTLGAMANYGTSPGAVLVPGVNAFVTNTVGVSGTVTANQGGAPWSENISQIGGAALSLGQNSRANSVPVTMASDQPPLNDNIQQIAGWPVKTAQPGVQLQAMADGAGNPLRSEGGGLNVVPLPLPFCQQFICVSGSGSQTSTTTTTIIPPVPGKTLYITGVQCSRDDAGTTAVRATLNDVSSTPVILPNSGGGGGNNMPLPTPLVVTNSSGLQFTPSSGVSTMRCSAQGYAA